MSINIGIIIRRIFWCLMNLASTLLIVSLYLIKSSVIFAPFEEFWLNKVCSYLFYMGVPIVLSLLFVKCNNKFCPKDSLNESVQKVSSSNKEYLPVYLSYFFVSLSVPGSAEHVEWGILLVFVLVIWVFTSATTTYYFNPLLLLLGYKFYNVVSHNGIELFVITKRDIKKNERNIVFPHLRKITEYVYVESKS